MRRVRKKERQQHLKERIHQDPFLTDEELASAFGVSVQTIRLDRLELGIPELRERVKSLAETAYPKVRSVSQAEIVGDLLEVSLGERGLSLLQTEAGMGFARSGILRGHHLFAQANSLAVALIDAEVVLTATSTIRFHRPVKVGERVVAKAKLVETKGRRHQVYVESTVDGKTVFSGEFVVVVVGADGKMPPSGF